MHALKDIKLCQFSTTITHKNHFFTTILSSLLINYTKSSKYTLFSTIYQTIYTIKTNIHIIIIIYNNEIINKNVNHNIPPRSTYTFSHYQYIDPKKGEKRNTLVRNEHKSLYRTYLYPFFVYMFFSSNHIMNSLPS